MRLVVGLLPTCRDEYSSLYKRFDSCNRCSFCRAMLGKRGFSRHAVSVCPSVCVSVTFVDCVKTNKHIFKIVSPSGSQAIAILVFQHQTAWQYSDANPPNGGVIFRWGRQKSRFWAYIWLHRELWTVPAASAIHLAATDHGEFITLVVGKPRSLVMAGNNDEVYDNLPQRYAEDNVTQQW